jgi:hypothetical protein
MSNFDAFGSPVALEKKPGEHRSHTVPAALETPGISTKLKFGGNVTWNFMHALENY